MFKKICPNCKNKIARGFNFCPICGHNLKKEKMQGGGLLDEIEDEFDAFGMPGSNEIENLTKEIGKSMGFDFIDRFPFNHIVRNLSKNIEKQFKDIDKEIATRKVKGNEEITRKNGAEIRRANFPGGFSIQIKIGSPVSQNTPFLISPGQTKNQAQIAARQSINSSRRYTEKEIEKISKLPKQEPETKVRRLTDSIIYEIELPGVKNKKDIIINKLENSIEIKALSKDNAFFKLIPVSLPIKRYDFRDGKLILELKPDN